MGVGPVGATFAVVAAAVLAVAAPPPTTAAPRPAPTTAPTAAPTAAAIIGQNCIIIPDTPDARTSTDRSPCVSIV